MKAASPETDVTTGADRAGAAILVVDDEESIRFFLRKSLGRRGFRVDTAGDGSQGLLLAGERLYDLVLLDLKMPGPDGMEVLERLRETEGGGPAVVMMSAHADVAIAVKALRRGADDFLTKPFEALEALAAIERTLESRALRRENAALRQRLFAGGAFGPMVGDSRPMRDLYALIKRVASAPSTVLITGESGTGKELVAREIHRRSPRADGPMLSVNCGAIPENLLESELFGYVPGAFSGADRRRVGLIEETSGGTLFLDEIGELPASLQPKLLRMLQERTVRPLGAGQSVSVDVRVIAASNRNLEEDVRTGRFREDLYYRVNVVPIHAPALRERREDIPALTEHFLRKHAHLRPGGALPITQDAMATMQRYTWPGNVRELENMVERVMILAPGSSITIDDLPANMRGAPSPTTGNRCATGPPMPYRDAQARFEREYLKALLAHTAGNVSRAAEVAGVSRPNLHRRLRECEVDATRYRQGRRSEEDGGKRSDP